ncbi:hypothetical protein [Phreatobacter stygius]|uniref:Twin-arginine translocation signal domain-containing protein n=1 Tax=Phreatobacter stygius TaxID=1940610 RepID=A0A4D7BKA8_9HYPH|nr:hypothetical protein [Phreatobacter stygius]QCI68187.1 hypothetical protein E8M01_30550 [Phreatobacter stygius]
MLDRRSFLAVLAGGVAVAAATTSAEAAPVPAALTEPALDTPRTVAGLREGLAATTAEPREMQYYYRRRYYYRRPVYVVRRPVYVVRRPRLVRRCVWTGYGRVCRVVRVW